MFAKTHFFLFFSFFFSLFSLFKVCFSLKRQRKKYITITKINRFFSLFPENRRKRCSTQGSKGSFSFSPFFKKEKKWRVWKNKKKRRKPFSLFPLNLFLKREKREGWKQFLFGKEIFFLFSFLCLSKSEKTSLFSLNFNVWPKNHHKQFFNITHFW